MCPVRHDQAKAVSPDVGPKKMLFMPLWHKELLGSNKLPARVDMTILYQGLGQCQASKIRISFGLTMRFHQDYICAQWHDICGADSRSRVFWEAGCQLGISASSIAPPAPVLRTGAKRRFAYDFRRPVMISSARFPASYTFRSASGIAGELTDTARASSSVNAKSHTSDWMLPSKIRPTTSAFLLTTGLPELPPMMSLVETKLNDVFRLSWLLRCTQRDGRSNGNLLFFSLAFS